MCASIHPSGAGPRRAAPSSRSIYWGSGYRDTPVLHAADLEVGEPVPGPVLVELSDTSVPVPDGSVVAARADGTLVVTIDEVA